MGKYIRCKKCEKYFTPFYFGNKSLNRNVIDECPNCGDLISFVPSQLEFMNEEEENKLRENGIWIESKYEEYSKENKKRLKEEYEKKYKNMKENDIEKLSGFAKINVALSKLLFEDIRKE